ncbi:Mfap1 [Bugula neritina]|uniref:Mfap1 n=1 Tax=Bugula neritina TaxID=10212 RepID=A0A7J7J104_BUGNE|nr:Mfap1 [Bugula neritina]
MAETKAPIQSTAGAVAMRNDKGELYTQKVRVNRYVTGKRPEYAPQSSSEEEDEDFIQKRLNKAEGEHDAESGMPAPINAAYDRRLARLQQARAQDNDQDDRSEIERRRAQLRLKARALRDTEENTELLATGEKVEGEGDTESSAEESEYEEYTDSEDEEDGPMLKPVFVRKKDRITIQEKQRQVLKERELELEAKKLQEERRAQARRLVEVSVKQEEEVKEMTKDNIDAVNTDDENDEEEYEAWKIRELKRMKRDREEREAHEKEKLESERFRNMTEEERKQELKMNPKKITNAAAKGKYRFMQKYYHRGVFYMDEEEEVLKRDYTAPTLEDHFDKTVIPKVMQVKNFGRSGRTKYTHLVDQDTTSYDSAWTAETGQNLKFHSTKGGGLKQSFEKPKLSHKK